MEPQRIDSFPKRKSVDTSYFARIAFEKRKRQRRSVGSLYRQRIRMKPVSTRSNPKDFQTTVSRLSKMKEAAICQMGLGNVKMIGCTRLHRSLCQMLVNRFDPANNSLQIHGRTFPVTYSDFQRIMGIDDVGLSGYIDDSYFAELRATSGGNESEITTDQLKVIVKDREEVDETFRTAFFRYTLATVLCPGASKAVDPKLLFLLEDTKLVYTKNWGRCLFDQLIEGLKAFKIHESNYLAGCILFLQLFYLDVVGHNTFLNYEGAAAVVAWVNSEVKKLVDWVERNGGFNSQTIFDTLSKAGKTSSKNALNLDQKVEKLRIHLEASQSVSSSLTCKVTQMEANFTTLDEKVGEIQCTLSALRTDFVTTVSTEVVKVLQPRYRMWEDVPEERIVHAYPVKQAKGKEIVDLDPPSRGNAAAASSEGPSNFLSPIISTSNVGPRTNLSASEVRVARRVRPRTNRRTNLSASEVRVARRVKVGPFYLRRALSFDDTETINTLFPPRPLSERRRSVAVARTPTFSLDRGTIQCLAPRTYITAQVIDLWSDYLNRGSTTCWFFSTFFGARVQHQEVVIEPMSEWVSRTRSICQLRRFDGMIANVNKIFIPMHDAVRQHWYLMVVLVVAKTFEIWDSLPDPDAATRYSRHAQSILESLDQVFLPDIQLHFEDQHHLRFESFVFAQTDVLRQPNGHDCAVFVIRTMQNYGERWYDTYHSDEQRVQLALDSVNNLHNDLPRVFLGDDIIYCG